MRLPLLATVVLAGAVDCAGQVPPSPQPAASPAPSPAASPSPAAWRTDLPSSAPGRAEESGFKPALVAELRKDLARRLSIPESEITVAAAGPVTWPDGSLGCPEPDKMYTQALVRGFVVRFEARGRAHSYHGSPRRAAFYCAKPAGLARPDAVNE